ncbi:MAG: DUF4184 family protein [Chitinophagaceae bacterium]|nr:MAG: DUF4184 family protein [Chitinophagaceae bacterium]
MPFTLSHPALVLPLNLLPKKWFSITGLVIGSLAPDLQAFFTTEADKAHTHTWWGILWFCIPVSLVLAFLYHLSVREMLITHLPRFFQLKYIRYKDFDWVAAFKKNWHVVIISIAIGAASHLFWDSFSHFDGFFIKGRSSLQGNAQIGGKSVEIPFLIQYLNSGIGLLIVLIALIQVPRCHNVRIRIVIMKYWLVMTLIAGILILFRLESMESGKLDDLLTSAISTMAVALMITSLLFKQGIIKDAWKPRK